MSRLPRRNLFPIQSLFPSQDRLWMAIQRCILTMNMGCASETRPGERSLPRQLTRRHCITRQTRFSLMIIGRFGWRSISPLQRDTLQAGSLSGISSELILPSRGSGLDQTWNTCAPPVKKMSKQSLSRRGDRLCLNYCRIIALMVSRISVGNGFLPRITRVS